MLTDRDFASIFFRRSSTSAGRLPVGDGGAGGETVVRPMRPFLVGLLLSRLGRGKGDCTAVRGVLGVPGDVGGREMGAELMEWAFLRCVCDIAREGPGSGERVFVKVMVTEKGSPAKYED